MTRLRTTTALSLVALVLFSVVIVASEQTTAAQVRLSGLKKVYKASESVVFTLTNTSKHPTNVNVFMAEVLEEGHWSECTEDIRRKLSGNAIYGEMLGVSKTVKLHWSTRQDRSLDSPMGRKPIRADRKYRFVFFCDKTQITSPVFVVQKPVIHRRRSR